MLTSLVAVDRGTEGGTSGPAASGRRRFVHPGQQQRRRLLPVGWSVLRSFYVFKFSAVTVLVEVMVITCFLVLDISHPSRNKVDLIKNTRLGQCS